MKTKKWSLCENSKKYNFFSWVGGGGRVRGWGSGWGGGQGGCERRIEVFEKIKKNRGGSGRVGGGSQVGGGGGGSGWM